MPYGITQCYLPPGKAGTRFSDPEGCKAELTSLAGYTPRWYTRPKTVTHTSINRARRRVTSLIRPYRYATQPTIRNSSRVQLSWYDVKEARLFTAAARRLVELRISRRRLNASVIIHPRDHEVLGSSRRR